jgi:hypothetical protein
MLIAVAENDVLAGSEKQRRFMIEGRKRGAAWTFVSRPGMGHCTTDAKWQTFMALWVEAIIPLRVPTSYNGTSSVNYATIDVSKGWLGGMKIEQTAKTSKYGPNTRIASAWVAKYDSFIGSKDSASWFPNENVAKAWLAYVTGNAEVSPVKVDVTSPVAMSNFKVARAADTISITITASASSTAGTLSGVTFFAQGQNSIPIGTVTTLPYTITWKFKACEQNTTSDEMYNIYATARDSKGNSTTSSYVPVVIACPGSVSTYLPARNHNQSVTVSSTKNMILFTLGYEKLNYKVQLFDTSGRLLYEKSGNSSEVQVVQNETLTHKVLVWKIIENHSIIRTGSIVN